MKPDHCTLTCFAREHGDDPHAVRLALDLADARRLLAQDERDRAKGREKAIGDYVTVTDQRTAKRYRVAWHPCGAGCRCALVALVALEAA